MKRIDVGNPSFEKLISNKNIYVDKTKYLYNLIQSGTTYFFCSRPRRFGKTLTLSTLESLFKGRKDLFENLYISKTDYNWKTYPIVHIDFSLCQAKTGLEVESWINYAILKIAEEYDVILNREDNYYQNTATLLAQLAKTENVVILVDEYDKVLSSNIFSSHAEEIRDVLRGFFETIKGCYSYIHFCLITGVTKYSKLSVFSSMNNLVDISMNDEYDALFGYTENELENYFHSYITSGAQALNMSKELYLERLKRKYDGYKFTLNGKSVYNPVSIGSFFYNGGKTFSNYWIETGNTKLLLDLSRKVNFNVDTTLSEPLDIAELSSFDILHLASHTVRIGEVKALLLQSGYLTIKKVTDGGYSLLLDYPNEEVCESFNSRLLNIYTGIDSDIIYSPNRMLYAFNTSETENAINYISSIYASIPYNLTGKNEANYHAMFHCMMKAIGAKIISEKATNIGRIDSVLETEKQIYLIEFKINKSANLAIKQIKNNEYYSEYLAENKTIHLLGISFSTTKKNIENWKEEIIEK